MKNINKIVNIPIIFFTLIFVLFVFIIDSTTIFALSGKSNNKKFKIITTIYPYYLIVKDIVKDRADLEVFLLKNVSPHAYSPTPKDIKRLNNADLVISNGLYLEANLIKILDALGEKHISASDFIDKKELYKEDVKVSGKIVQKPNLELGINPHVWVDPIFLIDIVNGIKEEIKSRDPANSKFYEEHCSNVIGDFIEIDRKIKEERKKYSQANIIVYHDGFRYFAGRYNINILAVIEPSPGQKPTPRRLVEIKEKVLNNDITAIFKEPELNPKGAEILAKELNLKILILDPLGYYVKATTISDLILKNWDTMKGAFVE